jgi:CubicO group peptidase (beta-lactamase class C family)
MEENVVMDTTRWMVRATMGLALGTLISACESPSGGDLAQRTVEWLRSAGDRGAYAPPNTPPELGIAGYAKVLCSAVFVSGRDPDEAARNSGFFMLAERDRDAITDITIDRAHQLVSMTVYDSITRTAKRYGDQGCVIHPRGRDSIFFTPVPVTATLPDASTMPWPMGDVEPDQPLPADVDYGKVEEAVNTAFADPDGLTAAFLVVHHGRIIAERYMPGIDKDTQLESWSMGKSVTATLFALLVADGTYQLDQPAPIPAWQQEGDPRQAIRIEDLFHMSSGLRFIATQDPDYDPEFGYPDHMYIYTGAVDAFEHSYTRPVQWPPNTVGRYRNSDPLLVGYLIKQAVTERGEEYLTFPQQALFDRIGIRRQVLETDPYGNFLLTGYDYGTARNWARLGMLYLQDGVWMGERILPEGWVDFVSTPAPAWDPPIYGGFFWLNRTGQVNLPKDAFSMQGGGGQRTFIVPSLDLVVVRLGHFRGNAPGMRSLNGALGLLSEAVSGQ